MSPNKANLVGAGGAPKQKTRTNTNDNLFSRDAVKIVLALGEGPIEGLATPEGLTPVVGDDFRNFFVGDVPLRKQDNTDNFRDLSATLYTGEASEVDIDLTGTGGQGNTEDVGVNVTKESPVKRLTPAELRGRITAVEVRIAVNQLYFENDDGVVNNTVLFQIEYKKSKAPDTTYINYEGDNFNPDYGFLSVTGKTTSGWIHDYVLVLPEVDPDPDDDWEIRVSKWTADYDPLATNYKSLAEISWESFQCMTASTLTHDNLAMVVISGKSSDQFNSVPDFYGIYRGLVVDVPSNYDTEMIGTAAFSGPWDGTFKKAWTDNPAWVFYDLVMNPRYGLRAHAPLVTINVDDVYRAGLYCNESVVTASGETQKRYTFNAVLSEVQPGPEVLDYVAGAFDAVWYDDGNGQISLKVDVWNEPTTLVTPECISPEGFQYSFSEVSSRVNDITVSFVNPGLGWVEDRRQVPSSTDPYGLELRERNGRVPMDFVAVGCTNEDEAVRRALRRLIMANTEITTATCSLPRLGALFEPFEIIYLADPDMLWGTLTGRIEQIQGRTIRLRDPLPLETGVNHTLKLQTYTGVATVIVRGNNNPATELTVQGDLPPYAPPYAQFAVVTDEYTLHPFRVLAIEDQESEGELLRLTALEVSKDKYLHDLLVVNNRYQIVFGTDKFNVNLYNEFYLRYGLPKQGMVVEFIVAAGVLLCSSSASAKTPAVTTGKWPNGVVPKLRLQGGRISGLGGKGGRGGRSFPGHIANSPGNYPFDQTYYYGSGKDGQNGGPGLFVLTPLVITFEHADSAILGGSGGGAGSAGVIGSVHSIDPFGGFQTVAYAGAGGGGGVPYGQGGLPGETNADAYTQYTYHDTYPSAFSPDTGGAGTDATRDTPGIGGPGLVDNSRLGAGYQLYAAGVGAAGDGGQYLTGNGRATLAKKATWNPNDGALIILRGKGSPGRPGYRGNAIQGGAKVTFQGPLPTRVIGTVIP